MNPNTIQKKLYSVAIFMKLGMETTNQHSGLKTLQIYEDFCRKNKMVWFSTDSLSKGMAKTRRLNFLKAIEEGFILEIYFVIGKNNGGTNQIVYRAEVNDLLTDSERIATPDANLTPLIWRDIRNKIWIKIKDISPYTKLTTKDFIVESSGQVLADSISNSQYNFGYIKRKI